MISPYRKAIAAFLTPLAAYLVLIATGTGWSDPEALTALVTALVTMTTVFLVPNDPQLP